MHRNPVVRGLVLHPEQWRWNSFRHYAYGEVGPVLINQDRKTEVRVRPSAVGNQVSGNAKVGQPPSRITCETQFV